jgi:hypothetical protein
VRTQVHHGELRAKADSGLKEDRKVEELEQLVVEAPYFEPLDLWAIWKCSAPGAGELVLVSSDNSVIAVIAEKASPSPRLL